MSAAARHHLSLYGLHGTVVPIHSANQATCIPVERMEIRKIGSVEGRANRVKTTIPPLIAVGWGCPGRASSLARPGHSRSRLREFSVVVRPDQRRGPGEFGLG